MKKILVLFLTLALVMSSFSIGVFAEQPAVSDLAGSSSGIDSGEFTWDYTDHDLPSGWIAVSHTLLPDESYDPYTFDVSSGLLELSGLNPGTEYTLTITLCVDHQEQPTFDIYKRYKPGDTDASVGSLYGKYYNVGRWVWFGSTRIWKNKWEFRYFETKAGHPNATYYTNMADALINFHGVPEILASEIASENPPPVPVGNSGWTDYDFGGHTYPVETMIPEFSFDQETWYDDKDDAIKEGEDSLPDLKDLTYYDHTDFLLIGENQNLWESTYIYNGLDTICTDYQASFRTDSLEWIVTYYLDDTLTGTPHATDTVDNGEGVEALPINNPTRANFTFNGWAYDIEGGDTTFNTDVLIYSDLDVYALWTPIQQPPVIEDPVETTTTPIFFIPTTVVEEAPDPVVEEIVELPADEEPIPLAPIVIEEPVVDDPDPESVEILDLDEPIPADVPLEMPQTSGIPASIFFALGSVLAGVGMKIKKH